VKKFLHFNVKNRKIWNNFSLLLNAALKQNDHYVIGLPATVINYLFSFLIKLMAKLI